jgi:opacity protein-like surface antigen
MNRSRACVFGLLCFLGGAQTVHAEWLLSPFAGAMVRTDTAFLDLDDVAGRPHATFGVALTRFYERVFGIDIETSGTPSVFTGHDLVQSSRVLTVTGSVVIALPMRWSRVVRPYAMVGAGLVHVTRDDIAGVFPIDSTRPAASLGAGAWLPMTRRLGARAEVRFMRSGSESSPSRFETWQTTAGVAVRF